MSRTLSALSARRKLLIAIASVIGGLASGWLLWHSFPIQ
jgi:hypothetical protein